MRDPLDGTDPRGKRTRLLVVEDEMSTIFALRSFFAYSGFDVDCAAGPGDGVHLLERNAYDAVITDLQLTPGGVEGFEVAEIARRRNPAACVVMLTAYGSLATERRARQSGVDVYQTKPIALDLLADAIHGVLEARTTCRPH